MDELIERQYEYLYLKFRDPYRLKYWIDDIAAKVAAPMGPRLRADARYLLLVNFTELVMRPAVSTGRVRRRDFQRAARDDIHTLVGVAAHHAEGEEISGHALINALTSVWDSLRTVAYNVWD
jgi:hypothetical protein